MKPPKNHPYQLHQFHSEMFMLARNVEEALHQAMVMSFHPKPSSYLALLKIHGHKKVRKLFLEFGDEWIISKDAIFYKQPMTTAVHFK